MVTIKKYTKDNYGNKKIVNVIPSENEVQLAPDNPNDNISADVYTEVVAIQDGQGNIIDPRQITITGDNTLAKESGGNLDAIKADVDKIPSKGQATMANSTPVVIASDQMAIPVTIGQLPAILDTDNRLKTAITPPQLLSNVADFTVTDAYTSVFSGAVPVSRVGAISFRVKELNYNACYYKILVGPASNDLDEILGETECPKNATAPLQCYDEPTMFVDIQVKNKVAGQVAHVKATLIIG